ncbi:TIM barrel protein [Paenibacillus sp. LMG 31458]|uniref:TIM barrel protein n=1 Tax=Paenibacillus phytorum TaxID=2654977 RepID=A0ABX1XWF6_9BACL|nr:sugar phosphate isomerase/epimerase family protein [Paenibacillus phytorum]NOU72271.1 TIM barrel protein [Paenibacillus phytorum]
MRYAISSNVYTRFSLLESIERIHHCGYSALEILADFPHVSPLDVTYHEAKQVSRLLEQRGMSVSNINANTAVCVFPLAQNSGETIFEPSLCNRKEEVRLQRIRYTERCIDLAVEWGASCVSITSGKCLAGNHPDQAYEFLVDSISRILQYAEKRNIRIGMEYEPGLLIENANEAQRVLETFDCNSFGINLDIGHAEVLGEPLAETIQRFNEKITNIHLEDIRGHKHYHLIPGEGDIHFEAVLEALQSIGYDRYITFEIYPYSDDPDGAAKRALAHMMNYNYTH